MSLAPALAVLVGSRIEDGLLASGFFYRYEAYALLQLRHLVTNRSKQTLSLAPFNVVESCINTQVMSTRDGMVIWYVLTYYPTLSVHALMARLSLTPSDRTHVGNGREYGPNVAFLS